MTTPTPAPGTAPTPPAPTGAQSQALKDAGLINLPTSLGSGSASKYGLTSAVSGSTVNLGGVAALLNLPATATADQVMKAFAESKNPAVIAKIQAYLQAARLYTSKEPVNMGIVGQADLNAFKSAVETVAQTGADFGDFLTRSAQFGAYTGLAATMTGKVTPIKTGDPGGVAALADKYYQSDAGRNATAKEKAAFLVAYNAAYKAAQEQQIAAEGTQVTAGDPGYSTAPITNNGMATPTPSDPFPNVGENAIAAAKDADVANLTALPTPDSVTRPTEQEPFNPDAFAEQYVRQHAGGEAAAHDVASTFSSFLSILQNGHP